MMKIFTYEGTFYPFTQEEIRMNNFVYTFTNASSIVNNNTLGHFVPVGSLIHVEGSTIHKVPANIVPPTLVFRFSDLEIVPITTEGTYGNGDYYIVLDPNSTELYIDLAFDVDVSGRIVKIAINQKDLMVHPDYNPSFEYQRITRSLYYSYYELGAEPVGENIVPCMILLGKNKKYSILYVIRKGDGKFILAYKNYQWNDTFNDPWFLDMIIKYKLQCRDDESDTTGEQANCTLRYAIPDMRGVAEQYKFAHSAYNSINDIRTFSVSR